MSAECYKHGTDLVYPDGSWPVCVCPTCENEKTENIAAMQEAMMTAQRLPISLNPEIEAI